MARQRSEVGELGIEGGLSRRGFLAGAGGLALSAAVAALPEALAARGWSDIAAASELDVTRDTVSGLVAFVTPGDDPYSVAQGVSREGPGGLAAGGTSAMIALLDRLVPAPLVGDSTRAAVPASALVAQALNGYAAQIAPAAGRGSFVSPFARLSFAEKAEVFRRIESDPTWDDSPVRYLGAALIGVVCLVVFSDAPRLRDGRVTEEPLGWRIAGYGGVSDGWDELKGYWGGRRAATGADRLLRKRRRGTGRAGRRRA